MSRQGIAIGLLLIVGIVAAPFAASALPPFAGDLDHELVRLAPKQIVILGGPAAVNDDIASQLTTFAPTTRLAGPDRYTTATAISQHAFNQPVSHVYIATGTNYPDALSGAAAAAHHNAPLLLVQGTNDPLSCLGTAASPSGRLTVVPGHSQVVGTGAVRTFAVEIEEGLGADGPCFTSAVESILLSPESWTRSSSTAFQRVDSAVATFRITLASPATTDRLCAPLNTGGIYSCWNGSRAVINSWRWEFGATAFGADLSGYRAYLINHEVGHALARSHAACPGVGDPAPVMMQQSKGVGACIANPWPLAWELP